MKSCYVIMPFSKTTAERTEHYWTEFFENFLKPALGDHGYEVKRSPGVNNITKEIIQDLAWSDLVLAVLTDAKPNVMWELGVRHSLRNGTIMILLEGENRPFDIQGYGIIPYRRDNLPHFTKELGKYIRSAEKREKDGPVADFLNQRITESVSLAVGRLKQCVQIMKNSSDANYANALEEIKLLQDTWDETREQVSVVIDNLFVLHSQKVTLEQKQRGDQQWMDNTVSPPKSLYPMMKERHSGFKIVQFDKWADRVTALAFEEVKANSPHCMVVAEAHYIQEDRPY